MIGFIGKLIFGIVRKVIYVALFLVVLYLGVFGSEQYNVKPFISNWVTGYVDNKSTEIKENISDKIASETESLKEGIKDKTSSEVEKLKVKILKENNDD